VGEEGRDGLFEKIFALLQRDNLMSALEKGRDELLDLV
jgi:hypothetical protein